jgi:cardiolipin synthase (CMP-forming)
LSRALPNLISLARLLLVPVVLLAIWEHRYERALVWCAIAGLSDGLDGFLARRLNAQTRLGAYLDPVADKLLLSGVYLTLGLDGVIPWWLTAVVFGRDGLMLVFLAAALLFTNLREFRPTIWGKISTAVQILTALVILVSRSDLVDVPRAVEFPFVVLTVVATGWSALHYAWVGLRMWRGKPAGVA